MGMYATAIRRAMSSSDVKFALCREALRHFEYLS